MSKIYYYQQEVKIGDKIELNDHTVTVTEQLIKDLPDKFKVKNKPLFTTEDGVDIYEGDTYWWADIKTNFITCNLATKRNGPGCLGSENRVYFSSGEAAEEYIAKHKEKTLEDYENELLCMDKVLTSRKNIDIYGDDFYRIIRKYEPKLYWTKVLQLIADDLNKNCNITTSSIYSITYIGGCQNTYGAEIHLKSSSQGVPRFLCESLAKKAIEIMGDKLDYIYKQ